MAYRDEYNARSGEDEEYLDHDRDVAGVFLWDSLSGAAGRRARVDAANRERRRQAALGAAAGAMPSWEDLSVEYGNEDYIGDETAEGAMARGNWMEWAEGGLTDADRAMMEESRRSSGRAARANREADLSAFEARGMGGSGASLAAALSAGEGAADRNAATDATMMGAAQQRQIAATDSLGDWAAGETSYGRDREGRNTDRENRTRESASEASQQNYENALSHTDRVIGYSPEGATAEEQDDDQEGLLGGIISELL